MIPRGVIDIDWRSLAFAMSRSIVSSIEADKVEARIEELWESDQRVLVCLSVRSAFEALLTALDWPEGSEILMSAVTIPDMARIVRAHGLVPIPIDVDAATLAPMLDQISARITSRTCAILVAHLFGSRLRLNEISAIARRTGLVLMEDVAQGFAADGSFGDPNADVSLFSFGLIKSHTALGGGLMRVANPDLADRCRDIIAGWPRQTCSRFRQRILRAMFLRMMGGRRMFTAVHQLARLLRADLDDWLTRSVRGFSSEDFFRQIQSRLGGPQLQLLERRLTFPVSSWIRERTRLGEDYVRQLPPEVVIGRDAVFPSRWVLPILCRRPTQLRLALVRRGYDATQRASQLRVIEAADEHSEWTAPVATEWVSNLLYLPLHPLLCSQEIDAICQIVKDAAAQ